jgi:hypothetical protein
MTALVATPVLAAEGTAPLPSTKKETKTAAAKKPAHNPAHHHAPKHKKPADTEMK